MERKRPAIIREPDCDCGNCTGGVAISINIPEKPSLLNIIETVILYHTASTDADTTRVLSAEGKEIKAYDPNPIKMMRNIHQSYSIATASKT